MAHIPCNTLARRNGPAPAVPTWLVLELALAEAGMPRGSYCIEDEEELLLHIESNYDAMCSALLASQVERRP